MVDSDTKKQELFNDDIQSSNIKYDTKSTNNISENNSVQLGLEIRSDDELYDRDNKNSGVIKRTWNTYNDLPILYKLFSYMAVIAIIFIIIYVIIYWMK